MAIPTYDWVAYHASTRGDHVAMHDLTTGRTLTYAEFNYRIGRLADGLRWRFGVLRGDRVAVLAHNSSDHVRTPVRVRTARRGVRADELAADGAGASLHRRRLQPVVMFYDPDFGETALELSAACGVRHLVRSRASGQRLRTADRRSCTMMCRRSR